MERRLQRQVWERAGGACEYCRMPQVFYRVRHQVDHVVAQQHGGTTNADNLALACYHCNAHKGPNLAGIDPETGRTVRLFNPREDVWAEHFQWDQTRLVGKTEIGRATIAVLAINVPEYLAVREALRAEGRFPF